MITFSLNNKRTLSQVSDEKVYYGDNKITKINFIFPEKIDEYPSSECEFILIAELELGWRFTYNISYDNPEIYITNDLTDKVQIIKFRMVIKYNGDVIGNTNKLSKQILPVKEKYKDLDPRGELDKIIGRLRLQVSELEQENESLENQITEKDEIISEKDNEIEVLSSEVGNLEIEINGLEEQHNRDAETIDQLNRRVPRLYTPPDPIEPSGETRVVTAPSGYDGLGSVTFLGTDYMNVDLQKWLSRESEEPFEITFNSNIGDYLCYRQIRMRKAVINCSVIGIQAFQYCSGLEEVVFSNNLTRINNDAFRNCGALYKIIIPSSITYLGQTIFSSSSVVILVLPNNIANLNSDCFREMSAVTTVNIPSSIISIGERVFYRCSSLQFVTIENGFNCNNLDLSASTLYSVETIVSWLEALADRTGQTAYTLRIGPTNINKLTAEQIAIATNKNWNLA